LSEGTIDPPPEREDPGEQLFEGEQLFDATCAEELSADTDLLLLGTSMFVLMSSWSSWVERRVEQVEFAGLNTVKRAISVDLYVPHELAPLRWPAHKDEHQKYALPVALYTKRRLNQFSLRDARDGALPLLARRHNVPLAAATLVAAARAWTQVSDDRPIPAPVLEDLWSIASLPKPRALGVWRALGRPLDPDDGDECAWRKAMVTSPEFMAMAIDFARNFVVAAIVTSKPGERRLIKFSYLEESHPTWLREEPVQPRHADDLPEAEDAPDTDGKGRVYIRATVAPETPGGASTPAVNVRYIVSGPAGRHFAVTDGTGMAVVQADAGEYHVVEEGLPPRLLPTTSTQRAIVKVAEDSDALAFEYRLGGAEPMQLPKLGVWEWARRAASVAPKSIVIEAPSIGHAHSYHLEFEVPAGMVVTRGRLLDASAYEATGIKPGHVLDRAAPTLQRVHVYTSEIGQERTGAGEFLLRPRNVTVLWPAVLVGFFTLFLLLLLVAISALSLWDSGDMTNRSPGTLATLLLLVPGGISAYISRGSEHDFTKRALTGVRLLALATGFWAFSAAATITIADLTAADGFAEKLGPWGPGFFALVLALVGQLITLTVLFVAYRRSLRPPERKDA